MLYTLFMLGALLFTSDVSCIEQDGFVYCYGNCRQTPQGYICDLVDSHPSDSGPGYIPPLER